MEFDLCRPTLERVLNAIGQCLSLRAYAKERRGASGSGRRGALHRSLDQPQRCADAAVAAAHVACARLSTDRDFRHIGNPLQTAPGHLVVLLNGLKWIPDMAKIA